MKMTIEIPDAHTGAILEFVSALVAKSLPVEATTDPAPGHPELPLMTAAVQMGKTESLAAWAETVTDIDAADPLKVAMDEPVRVEAVPGLPTLPKGIPAPPEGFAFVTEGELPVQSDKPTHDIAWLAIFEWDLTRPWSGCTEGPWAVRIGSDIAKANGINL